MALSRKAGALFGLGIGLIVTVGIFTTITLLGKNKAELTKTQALPPRPLPAARAVPPTATPVPTDTLPARLAPPLDVSGNLAPLIREALGVTPEKP